MKGQTLIEVLVALSIAVVILSAITIVSVSSLNNAQFSNKQEQATKYAQEGIELVRTIRNTNYSAFASYAGTYCLNAGQTTLGSPGSCTTPNIASTFIRTVQIQQNAGCGVNLTHVAVTLSWTDAKCQSGIYCHKSQLVSCLSTVNPVSGP